MTPQPEATRRPHRAPCWAVFQELGQALERRWDAADRDERAFPALAEAALAEAAPHLRTTMPELLEGALFLDRLPPQRLRPFGQPPLNLYVGEGFYIEANLWMDGTTTIHEHGFSGAFCLLAGRSLHARYVFHEDERICARLRLGRMEPRALELLAAGQVRRIEAGSRLIHAAFHLDRPSVSVVVRTESDPECGPQLDYLPPGVAVDPRPPPEPWRTRLAVLDTLALLDPVAHQAALMRLLRTANRPWTHQLLAGALRRLGDGAAFAAVAAVAAERHPRFAALVVAALREAARQEALIARRATLREDEDRLLLALLAVALSRDALYEVLATASPEAPEDWLLRGLARLAQRDAAALRLVPANLIPDELTDAWKGVR